MAYVKLNTGILQASEELVSLEDDARKSGVLGAIMVNKVDALAALATLGTTPGREPRVWQWDVDASLSTPDVIVLTEQDSLVKVAYSVQNKLLHLVGENYLGEPRAKEEEIGSISDFFRQALPAFVKNEPARTGDNDGRLVFDGVLLADL